MVATGLLTKGIELAYATASGGSYTKIDSLISTPDLGGDPNNIDVTTLDDGNYRYIPGLLDYGSLDFTFLYDNSSAESNYRILRGLEESGDVIYWQLTFPDGTAFTFSGQVTTKVSGGEPDNRIEFVASIALNSSMEVANPA